jgi:hypothetical protein
LPACRKDQLPPLDADLFIGGAPSYGHIAELLNFPGGSWTSFIGYPRRFVEGVFVPAEGLYAAAFFGLVALDLFTTTGMRMNEAMQVQLSREGLVKEIRPAPPGAQDQTPRVRWVARFEQQLRDCHTQLHEMDLIEQYTKDEQRGSFIALDTLTTR